METGAVSARLNRAGAGEFITPNRVRHLRALSEIYAEQRLLGKRSAAPLHQACADSGACWRGLPEGARPIKGSPWGFYGDKPGSIMWPWVGERYAETGVVLITLNFRSGDDEASVALEYLAAQRVRDSLKAGRKKVLEWNSTSHYGFLATAAAVIASKENQPIQVEPEPTWLSESEIMEQVAHVQLVKCTPVDTAVAGGAPTSVMCERCPQRFLWKEIDVLRPTVVVGFGCATYKVMEGHPGVTWRCGANHCRGILDYGAGCAALLWVWHPSRLGKWRQSQKALVRSLRHRPLGAN